MMATSNPRGWRRASQRGAALVELAVALPVLVTILVGTIDFGRIFYTAMAVTNAARAGSQYGAQSLVKSTDTAGMQAAALNSVAADNISGLTASANSSCVCWTDDGLTSASPSPNSCLGVCPSSSYHLIVNVRVTAQATFRTVMNYPGIPRTLTISRTASMRAQ